MLSDQLPVCIVLSYNLSVPMFLLYFQARLAVMVSVSEAIQPFSQGTERPWIASASPRDDAERHVADGGRHAKIEPPGARVILPPRHRHALCDGLHEGLPTLVALLLNHPKYQ